MREMLIDDMVKVGMGDLKVASYPNQIITLGLGSCVGITMFDPVSRVGGLLHAMLPNSARIAHNTVKAKFVDTGIVELLHEMESNGANLSRLQIKLFGGAMMFPGIKDNTVQSLSVGENNVKAAKEWLKRFGLPLIAEETGANFGRTIVLDTESGEVEVRAIGQEKRIY